MKKIIPFLFFFFLTAPIFSPYAFGMTIYISSIIVFFDVYFIKWAINRFTKDLAFIVITLVISMSLVSLNAALSFKALMLLVSVCYMFYCYENAMFYLYGWITVNVIVALCQFILIFIDPALAYLIGPTNISETVLGSFAGPTFTNFYAISLLPRVSGLSREGGFFASLLGVTFFLLINDKSVSKSKKVITIIFIIIGIIISLSKTTSILLLIPIILLLRRYINILKPHYVAFIYIFTMVCITNYALVNTSFFRNIANESLIHRFCGYALTPYAGIEDYIRGASISTLMIKSREGMETIASIFKEGNLAFCGLPGVYFNYGILAFVVFLMISYFLKLKGTGMALIILLTTSVAPLTNDGFVVVSWFFGCFISYDYQYKYILKQ